MLNIIRNIFCRFLSLSRDSKLHEVLVKLAFILIPVIIGLGFVEYKLSKIPVSYSQKRHKIEHQLNKIEVLVLGSSNAYYGVNPHYFSYKGFNFAYRAQWPYYDYKLLEKYLNKMPNLKLVIYPITYFAVGTRVTEVSDFWRSHFYEQYYGIVPPSKQKIDLVERLDARHFSKIALFGERTKDYLLGKINEGEADEDKTGWFNAGIKPCDLSLNIGLRGAQAHNSLVNLAVFPENIIYFEKIEKMLRKRNIKLVMVELPESSVYTKNLDPIKYAAMENAIQHFVSTRQIQYFNYIHDKRFTLNDFTDMPDHLNAVGAKKISILINHDIILPAMRHESKIAFN